MKPLSEFRKNKLLKLFRLYDANNNGVLDINDFDLITESFIHNFSWNWNAEASSKLKTFFIKYWTKLLRYADKNRDNKITEKEFLDYYEKVLYDDRMFFIYIKPFFDEIFSYIDVNRDGVLSKDDVANLYSTMGLSEEFSNRYFNTLDKNKDGVISHLELYTTYYNFHMNEDKRHKSKDLFGPFH